MIATRREDAVMSTVKCGECGFIAARVWHTTEFSEIAEEKRNSGKIGSDRGGHEPVPVCFINSFNIKEEVEILRKAVHDEPLHDAIGGYISPKWEIYVEDVLNTERKCKSFRKWQQGFSPREHREMIDREQERKWRRIELFIFVVITLIAGIGGAIVGALIATGKIG